jgi:NADH:ubiquinone oxidoreductase subunit 2 (subunit N)
MKATIKLFVVFFIVLFIGQAGSIVLGLLADQYSSTAGVAVFIPAYYFMFWVAWRVALFVAERDTARSAVNDKGGIHSALWLLAPAALTAELCD